VDDLPSFKCFTTDGDLVLVWSMTVWLCQWLFLLHRPLIGSLNYIVTVINLRTEGCMTGCFNYLGLLCYRLSLVWFLFLYCYLQRCCDFLIEVSEPLFPCLIFILLVKCYIIKVDRLFYLSTYFGFWVIRRCISYCCRP
jgi:hypothetical protein